MDVTIVTVTRPEITANVTRGAARLLVDLGYAPLAEVTLPNSRRADLMALSPKGELAIIEVKSGIEDYRVDRKWHEYLPYCDRFAFAVAPEFPQHILPEEPGLRVRFVEDGDYPFREESFFNLNAPEDYRRAQELLAAADAERQG